MATLGAYASVGGTDTEVGSFGDVGYAATAPHVAMVLLMGLAFITALRLMGFRAMIAVGRG